MSSAAAGLLSHALGDDLVAIYHHCQDARGDEALDREHRRTEIDSDHIVSYRVGREAYETESLFID